VGLDKEAAINGKVQQRQQTCRRTKINWLQEAKITGSSTSMVS